MPSTFANPCFDIEISHETFSQDLSKFPSIIFAFFWFLDETFELLQFKFPSFESDEIQKKPQTASLKEMEKIPWIS